MPKAFLCRYTLTSLSHPPTSRPSRDIEWDRVGATDPLTVWEFQEGGEAKVSSPKGQISWRHIQAHIPTSSSLSSWPQDSRSGGSWWQRPPSSGYPLQARCATNTRDRESGETRLHTTLPHLTMWAWISLYLQLWSEDNAPHSSELRSPTQVSLQCKLAYRRKRAFLSFHRVGSY